MSIIPYIIRPIYRMINSLQQRDISFTTCKRNCAYVSDTNSNNSYVLCLTKWDFIEI